MTELGSYMHVLNLMAHVAAHLAGHHAVEAIKWRVNESSLRNHDLQKCFRKSYLAALELLDQRYRANTSERARRKAARLVFRRLRLQAVELFPIEQTSVDPLQLRVVETSIDPKKVLLVDELLRRAGSAPQDIRQLLATSFLDAFAYAFREFGLKRNEAVRSVIFHELLTSLHTAEQRGTVLLHDLENLVKAQDSKRSAADVKTQKQMEDISHALKAVRVNQDAILRRLSARDNTIGSAAAYVTLGDADGYPLARVAIRAQQFTIGRARSNDLVIDDKSVGRNHATIIVEAAEMRIRDNGSVNKTRLNGDKFEAEERPLDFGDLVQIGPVVLQISPGDSENENGTSFETLPALE